MNKIILKKINVGDRQINLKNGMNIVIGGNGSGKTVLFNSMMYIMGLKKQINIDTVCLEDLYIDFKVSESSFRIERKVNSNEVIFSGGINEKVRIGSNKYYEIYSKILNPSFNFGEDKIAATEILEASFLPGIKISRINTETVKKVFGINTRYLKKSKEQMKILEQEIINKENSYNLLKEYMSKVCEKIKKSESIENKNTQIVEKILKDEYSNLCERIAEDKMLINQSRDAYEKIRMFSDERVYTKVNELERDFQKICGELNVPYNYKFVDILENKSNLRTISLGEDMLMQAIVALVLSMQNNFQDINSTGILITDSSFDWEADFQKTIGFRAIISQACENNKLQYIEFTRDRSDIPREWIVCDLNKGERLKWREHKISQI